MRFLSTREFAEVLGVSDSSLKRWVDSGKIRASRTEGGHRRIAVADALVFIRQTHASIARPELLDVPEVAVARARGEDRLADYLRDGDGVAACGWLIARYLEGATITGLADGPIREAMSALGELWHHDDAGVFVEHRGTAICLQAVARLRSLMLEPPATAPIAFGGAPSGDPYQLPTQLAAMVVNEAGLRAVNLGSDTPVSAFSAAAAAYRPALVWLSVSTPLAPARAGALSRWLETLPNGTAIIVGGGQAVTLSHVPARAVRASSFADLAALARSLRKHSRAS